MLRKTIFAVIALLLLSGCTSNQQELETVTLMLDYTPNTNHTGIYVADSLGYYEENGIDLQIIQPSDMATEAVVASGSSQFGISYGENVAMFNDSNQQLKSIYGILNTNTSGFLSRSDRDITSPSDFEGKTYCGWGSAIETSLIKTLVEADGGDFSKVDIITAPSNLLSPSDKCDFIWAYENWDKINLEQNEVEVNYLPFNNYGVDWYTPVIITSNDYIQTSDDTVSRFIEATQRGYQYALDNPEASAEILLESAPELDEELTKQSQIGLSNHYQTNGQPLGYQDPDIWQDFTSWLNANQLVSETDSTKFYSNQYV